MFYYKICNLNSRISNPDQRLTQDAEKWAQSLSGLYLNITKPILDIVMFSRKLAELVVSPSVADSGVAFLHDVHVHVMGHWNRVCGSTTN